jgi:hypothetical protein
MRKRKQILTCLSTLTRGDFRRRLARPEACNLRTHIACERRLRVSKDFSSHDHLLVGDEASEEAILCHKSQPVACETGVTFCRSGSYTPISTLSLIFALTPRRMLQDQRVSLSLTGSSSHHDSSIANAKIFALFLGSPKP